ncbi:MAG: biotin--[acetyl-CoA-carboxylase] ligase [Clostridia bacterium]|nr:biotin--[acetyl-CoA-carboxylase] ligase [Clostridia bacterium]
MNAKERLDAASIEKKLREAGKEARVAVFPTLASTNTTARQMAADGAQNGAVVIAEWQSAGRGRMSRSFFSPDGTGLYMSLIVRRPLPAADATRLTTAAAVATAQAIEALSGRDARIKWINDIYLDGKKVCGILTEGHISPESGLLDYAIVGIGVNIAPPESGFPPEIADIATAVFTEKTPPEGAREQLAVEIINRLLGFVDDLISPSILTEYRRRALYLGERVFVRRVDETPRAAIATEIDDEFRLVVRYEDGTTEALDSGEVSVKKM